MFEREVRISSLRKSSKDLSKLVEELEEKNKLDGGDLRYHEEVLKKIESALRKVRKMEEKTDHVESHYGVGFIKHAW